jgi:hypothetical protein
LQTIRLNLGGLECEYFFSPGFPRHRAAPFNAKDAAVFSPLTSRDDSSEGAIVWRDRDEQDSLASRMAQSSSRSADNLSSNVPIAGSLM